ncbi:MAG: hypothetical protein IID51_08340 [Proteobacteria bacterium]|nr:hypothetical protein [Pseudomonadota bacterium]
MTSPAFRATGATKPRGAHFTAVIAATLVASCSPASEPDAGAADPDAPSISHGLAQMIDPYMYACDVPKWRPTAQGRITASDGTEWTVPADVAFKTGPRVTDMYNDCTGIMLGSVAELDLESVPIAEIDADGEVITAYFFVDNYMEAYVNGTLVGADAVPYWPFNSSVVRFRVKRPFTAAFKLVDWEENLGIGSEVMRGVPFHQGDGGMTAVYRNEAGETIGYTSGEWRAQVYYISPLRDPKCLGLADGARLTDQCEIPTPEDGTNVYAAHWPVPEEWAKPEFDDSNWPLATIYTNEAIGVSIQRPAYENFADIFDDTEADAAFIWSSNLLLDNLVLLRNTIE